MTSSKGGTFRLLDALPKQSGRTSSDVLNAAAEAEFNARIEARRRSQAADDAAHDALRSAFSAIPGVAGAIPKRQPQPRLSLPEPALAVPQAAPLIKTASLLVATPPFIPLQGWSRTGSTGVDARATAGGFMAIDTTGGQGPDGKRGSGTASAWAAVGHAVEIPEGHNLVGFESTCSFQWACHWWSNWWRLADGNVRVGQMAILRNKSGVYLRTPVDYGNIIYQFYDRNLVDSGTYDGSSLGYRVTTSFIVEGPAILECYVKISCYADGNTPDSYAYSAITLGVPSISISMS